jgi:hypothetical protein
MNNESSNKSTIDTKTIIIIILIISIVSIIIFLIYSLNKNLNAIPILSNNIVKKIDPTTLSTDSLKLLSQNKVDSSNTLPALLSVITSHSPVKCIVVNTSNSICTTSNIFAYPYPDYTEVPRLSSNYLSIIITLDGLCIAISTSNDLYVLQNIFNPSYNSVISENIIPTSNKFIAITQLFDRSFIVIETDYKLYKLNDLVTSDLPTTVIPIPKNTFFISIIQLKDGSFLAIMTNNYLYKISNIKDIKPEQLKCTEKLSSIMELTDGTFIGTTLNNLVFSMKNLNDSTVNFITTDTMLSVYPYT